MRNKVSKSTTHYCVGKGMVRKDSVIVTTLPAKDDMPEQKTGEQFASVRLAKFFMRTGRRAK